jgi:hypothetical protein
MTWLKIKTIPQDILDFMSQVTCPMQREWTGHMTKVEMDYRREVPEGRVVDALEAYVDAYRWVPGKESEGMWAEVLKALAELDKGRMERLEVAQELYDMRYGEQKLDGPSKKDEDDELNAFYSG